MAGVSNLPLSLQDRILFFAGDVPTSSSGTNAITLEQPLQQNPEVSTYVEQKQLAYRNSSCVLSLDQLFVLFQEEGPGFVIVDDFLGTKLSKEVSIEAKKVKNELKAARMGRGIGKFVDEKSRGDLISWVSPYEITKCEGKAEEETEVCIVKEVTSTTGLNPLLHSMDRLKQDLGNSFPGCVNKTAELGKRLQFASLSHQLACYPGNSTGYVRHRDAYPSKDGSGRYLTAIYYLNEDWQVEDGGCLRLYLPRNEAEEEEFYCDVSPKLDKLLIFRADRVDHEVLATYRDRFAITTWFSLLPTPSTTVPSSLTTPTVQVSSSSSLVLDPSFSGALWSHVRMMGGDDRPHPTVRRRKPLPSSSVDSGDSNNSPENELSIFVSIASFRDPECQHTLKDLFDTAQYPNRVFVGVVGQYAQGSESPDSHCFTECPLPSQWRQQVACFNLDADEAQGPCWARYLAQRLYNGQEFFMQIDSHMRFRPNWDSYLIESLARCPSACPVLTTYPAGYTTTGKGEVKVPIDYRPTVLCPTHFGEDGMLRQTGKLLRSIEKDPLRCYLWAGGFNFGRASDVLKAPYDPDLKFLFFGEEISMAARLWTNGVDCFAPPETVCFHLWSRALRPVHGSTATLSTTNQNSVTLKLNSQRRVRLLLGMKVSPPEEGALLGHKYGLGTARDLASLEHALGVAFNPSETGICYSHGKEARQQAHVPRITRADAKWGGLSSQLFDETRASALLAALGVSS